MPRQGSIATVVHVAPLSFVSTSASEAPPGGVSS